MVLPVEAPVQSVQLSMWYRERRVHPARKASPEPARAHDMAVRPILTMD